MIGIACVGRVGEWLCTIAQGQAFYAPIRDRRARRIRRTSASVIRTAYLRAFPLGGARFHVAGLASVSPIRRQNERGGFEITSDWLDK